MSAQQRRYANLLEENAQLRADLAARDERIAAQHAMLVGARSVLTVLSCRGVWEERRISTLKMLDAFLADVTDLLHEQAPRDMLTVVFKHCRVVFYPNDGRYPIEHNPHANKDSMVMILDELAGSQPIPSQPEVTAPFPNCKYQHCDLPGQCVSEGTCHHPKEQPQVSEAVDWGGTPNDQIDAARWRHVINNNMLEAYTEHCEQCLVPDAKKRLKHSYFIGQVDTALRQAGKGEEA